MFRGVNHLTVDAKGRMAMPARYRDRLVEMAEGQLVVTVDFDRCLLIYPAPEWQLIEAKLKGLPTFDPKARAVQRLLVGHATECEFDSAGRILLTQPLREFAGIGKRAVLVGQMNKFELWDEEAWLSQRDDWVEQARPDADGNLAGSALGSISI